MKPADLIDLLVAVHRDKAALRRRHAAFARGVRDYEANNTYQYVIAREDVHLSWLADAIADLGGPPPAAPDGTEPASGQAVPSADAAAVARGDLDAISGFLVRWQDRVSAVTHARHRLMLGLLVGETREQARLFEQVAAGRADMLGRRTTASPATGCVLPDRWVE